MNNWKSKKDFWEKSAEEMNDDERTDFFLPIAIDESFYEIVHRERKMLQDLYRQAIKPSTN